MQTTAVPNQLLTARFYLCVVTYRTAKVLGGGTLANKRLPF
jgi:hypothetical protein